VEIMTNRSTTIWDESPVERMLMKLYRVPPAESIGDGGLAPNMGPSRETPKAVRAAARQELQRELTQPWNHLWI